ncbi:MAG: hypothetical protein IIC89_05085 [Chloroflexi bacterium]|nr:hypothetical protein [Chloroflexota bacterium]
MKAATTQIRLDRLERGEWLNRLLADVQQEIAREPSTLAVERMRNRLFAEMQTPVRLAA